MRAHVQLVDGSTPTTVNNVSGDWMVHFAPNQLVTVTILSFSKRTEGSYYCQGVNPDPNKDFIGPRRFFTIAGERSLVENFFGARSGGGGGGGGGREFQLRRDFIAWERMFCRLEDSNPSALDLIVFLCSRTVANRSPILSNRRHREQTGERHVFIQRRSGAERDALPRQRTTQKERRRRAHSHDFERETQRSRHLSMRRRQYGRKKRNDAKTRGGM